MFAAVTDMEPGMWFRTHPAGQPLAWLGVEHIVSRFPGKRRVRVRVRRGESFVCDAGKRFQIIEW